MNKIELNRDYRDKVISELVTEIVKDYNNGDYTVFEELVSNIGVDVLAGSLSQDIVTYSEKVMVDSLNKNNTNVSHYLESLVQKRFTITELENKLSSFFDENIILESTDESGSSDVNLLFNAKKLIFVDGDIYVLPTKEIKNTEIVYYVTEVAYDFG